MAEANSRVVHEAGDISLRGIGAGVGVIVAGIAIAVGVPWLVIAASSVPSNAPSDAVKPRLQAPVQETAPLEDIAALRRDKMRRLESEGIDPSTGAHHIPIERAMRMLAARSPSSSGEGGGEGKPR
jgi:hypothetical protein